MARVLHGTARGLVPSAVLILEAARVDPRRQDRPATESALRSLWPLGSIANILFVGLPVEFRCQSTHHSTRPLGAPVSCATRLHGGHYGKYPANALRDLRHARVP
jgi:hypothetical protein